MRVPNHHHIRNSSRPETSHTNDEDPEVLPELHALPHGHIILTRVEFVEGLRAHLATSEAEILM